jgi:ComF family protein
VDNWRVPISGMPSGNTVGSRNPGIMQFVLQDPFQPKALLSEQAETGAAMSIDDDVGTMARRAGSASGLTRLLTNAARAVADLVVPPLCLNCRRPLGSHDALCAACWRQIRFIRPPLCDRLGIPLPFDTGGPTVSAAALANPPDWDRARAVAQFGSVVRDMIHAFKYADRHDARRLFGCWLAGAGAELLADADLIVPVPMHRWRLLRRKFNQAALLAGELARITPVPSDPLVIERIKSTPAQVGLTAAERRRGLSGAFRVPEAARSRIADRKLVLVDDVITTGSTAAACARVLRRAGAARVDVLALALVTDDSLIGN